MKTDKPSKQDAEKIGAAAGAAKIATATGLSQWVSDIFNDNLPEDERTKPSEEQTRTE